MRRRGSHPQATELPPLLGLVLAGGRGTRIGREKGTLDYHGRSQVVWALELLSRFCRDAYVSVRRAQASELPYSRLPVVIDDAEEPTGPAAGLAAAFRLRPEAAWLTVAADMPLLDAAMLEVLCNRRDPARIATAYRHGDGTPEPLCTIWEPASRQFLERAGGGGSVSLRRVLEDGPALLLDAADPARLRSVNVAGDDAAARERIALESRRDR
jgi:molybdopterin-guanine dinucleotide biosynthesis protein A